MKMQSDQATPEGPDYRQFLLSESVANTYEMSLSDTNRVTVNLCTLLFTLLFYYKSHTLTRCATATVETWANGHLDSPNSS